MDFATVLIKKPGSQAWENQGKHGFASFPRQGEYIEIKHGETPVLFKVVAFKHPLDPGNGQVHSFNSGEIYAVEVGRSADVLNELFERV